MKRVSSFVCRVCGKRVRTRKGESFSNRSVTYGADHKDASTGKPCEGWSARMDWHIEEVDTRQFTGH